MPLLPEDPSDSIKFNFQIPSFLINLFPSSLLHLVSCNNINSDPNRVEFLFNKHFLLGMFSPLKFQVVKFISLWEVSSPSHLLKFHVSFFSS